MATVQETLIPVGSINLLLNNALVRRLLIKNVLSFRREEETRKSFSILLKQEAIQKLFNLYL